MAGDRKKFLRRRLVAAAVLVAGVVLVVVLLSSGGSDQPEQVGQGAKASSTPGGHPPARPGHKRLAPVPVLMYHGVEAPIPGGLPTCSWSLGTSGHRWTRWPAPALTR